MDGGTGSTSAEAESAVDPLILAIDVGTSSARGFVFDANGRTVNGWGEQKPYRPQTTAGGGVEIDAQGLLALVVQTIDAIHVRLGAAGRRVAAVACDTFWHSLLGVDAAGEPLTPVYTWADTRSRDAASELRDRLDGDAIHARTGAVLHSSYLPAKLLWIQQTQPRTWNEVAFWMSFGEFVYLHLAGVRRASISMASATGLFDQNACRWDAELLQALSLSEERLSPIAEYTEAEEHPRPNFARRWPLLDGIPWYLPLGDGACNNIGSGGVCDDRVVLMVGTSGALRVVREVGGVDIPPRLWTYRVDRRRFIQGGALSEGGNLFAWLGATLRVAPAVEVEREVAAMQPDTHGLTILPFLAGERSPDWNDLARSAFVGMTLNTTAPEIVRAALEAVACRFALVYDLIQEAVPGAESIIGSGAGLLRSPVWIQMMSDALGRPIQASAVAEATSRGAALMGLEALGAVKDLTSLPVTCESTYHPNPEHVPVYRALRVRQERLYARLIDSPPVKE